MPLKIQNQETVVFIGDSITDCGRRGTDRPLGCGYVKMFADLLIIREPEKKIVIINEGIGGDNVRGLRNRWTDDVLRHRPDWLSIKIGINDLHGYLRDRQNGIAPQVFAQNYTAIMEIMKAKLPKCRILLIEPFYISVERSVLSDRRAVLNLLPEYDGVVRRLSREYGTRLVRTQDMFQRLLKSHAADTFCPEPIHPNATGHLAIAEAVFTALSR